MPKKKLLEEAAKINKVLSGFKTHSIPEANELFFMHEQLLPIV